LGVEIPAQDVPLIQKQIIRKCNESGKPVITATQMLDSMQAHPRPTRAEVGDVANAILDGTDAVMLSGETAAGKYPVESVQMMAQIAMKTENSPAFEEAMKRRNLSITLSVTNAISHATVTTAEELEATAIITSTSSGHTAREVSKHRPACPIIAVTPFDRVMRRVALVWGVKPFKVAKAKDTDTVIENAVNRAMEVDLIQPGDLVVISAGIPIGIRGATNMIKIHIAGEILLKGMGIGSNTATGRVCIANTAEEAEEKFEPGDILVTQCTAKDMVKYMERAAGIVTEAGGLTSHAAVVGLTLGKVTIVGVDNATEQLKDGYIVTIDAQGGLIYKAQR
jgi:pyruvate kinase